MQYKLLGKSGLRVAELALGTMTFGEEWGWGADRAESAKIFDAYMEAGGNFIDTANRYTEGSSERFVGEFIAAERERFVLATKYTLFMRREDPNGSGNHRKNMVQALEASLKRLNTEYIDLYWLHAWDFTTPVDEVLRGLDDLVRAGKILYIGISDTPAWVVAQANTMAELRGWTRFVGLQCKYNLLCRDMERDLLPMAQHFDIGITAWSTLAAGILTGKYNSDDKAEGRAAQYNIVGEKELEVAAQVVAIAGELGCTAGQVANAWVRTRAANIIPIIGARNVRQLQDNLGCINVQLETEHIQRLEECSAFKPGFPHEFLQSDNVRDLIFGGTYGKLINHRL